MSFKGFYWVFEGFGGFRVGMWWVPVRDDEPTGGVGEEAVAEDDVRLEADDVARRTVGRHARHDVGVGVVQRPAGERQAAADLGEAGAIRRRRRRRPARHAAAARAVVVDVVDLVDRAALAQQHFGNVARRQVAAEVRPGRNNSNNKNNNNNEMKIDHATAKCVEKFLFFRTEMAICFSIVSTKEIREAICFCFLKQSIDSEKHQIDY